jgi:hypothetical protein
MQPNQHVFLLWLVQTLQKARRRHVIVVLVVLVVSARLTRPVVCLNVVTRRTGVAREYTSRHDWGKKQEKPSLRTSSRSAIVETGAPSRSC